MSNRSKHLSNNFARQVIEQPFDDVIDDDDVNIEPLTPQPNLIVQLTKERKCPRFH